MLFLPIQIHVYSVLYGLHMLIVDYINQIKNCNPQSAYANHIIQNKHEFGPAETTLKLLK